MKFKELYSFNGIRVDVCVKDFRIYRLGVFDFEQQKFVYREVLNRDLFELMKFLKTELKVKLVV